MFNAVLNWSHFHIKGFHSNSSFDQVKTVLWIVRTLIEVIVPTVQEKIDKPLVEVRHIRSSIEIINNCFFTSPDSLVKQYHNKFQLNEFKQNVLKYVFYGMWVKYIQLKQDEKRTLREEQQTMIRELYCDIEKSRELMKSSIVMGKQTMENVLKNLRNELVASFVEKTNNDMRKVIDEILKSPKDLLEKAFNRSFRAYNYEAVFKYVRNVVKYCNEVCENDTDEKIKATIRDNKAEFNKTFGSFFESSITFAQIFKQDGQFTIYKILEELISYLKANDKDELAKSLSQAKKSIINLKIGDIAHFIKSFLDQLIEENKKFKDTMENEDKQLENAVKENLSKVVKNVIGCEARCPGCGSKCNLDCDHKGSHHSEYHIYNGFFGWRYIGSDIVNTHFCWENAFYKGKVVVAKDEYKGLEDYLEKCHTNWVDDVKEKHVKFGQASIAGTFLFAKNINTNCIFL